jgi:uncharacterized protein (DUF433 family)
MTEIEKTMLLSRITMDKTILAGKPVIRKMRISVEQILDMLGAGFLPAQITEEFPFLESDDIKACILFANKLVKEESLQEVTI